jgi:hypothetical protein
MTDSLMPEGYAVTPGSATLRELLPASYNPRVMPTAEKEKLIRSLATFGFVEPAVVRAEDGLLIGGHQRADCWREHLLRQGLTIEEVLDSVIPVMRISGLSDERAKLLNLALNKITGEWDHGKLAELLGSMSALPTLELELSGFLLPEIGDYTAMLGGIPALGAHAGAGGGAASSGSPGGGGGDSGSAGGGDGAPATEPGASTVADVLAGAATRLVVEFPFPEDAAEAHRMLARFGMTGDADAPVALLLALRTAEATLPPPEALVTPAGAAEKRKRAPKASAPAA